MKVPEKFSPKAHWLKAALRRLSPHWLSSTARRLKVLHNQIPIIVKARLSFFASLLHSGHEFVATAREKLSETVPDWLAKPLFDALGVTPAHLVSSGNFLAIGLIGLIGFLIAYLQDKWALLFGAVAAYHLQLARKELREAAEREFDRKASERCNSEQRKSAKHPPEMCMVERRESADQSDLAKTEHEVNE